MLEQNFPLPSLRTLRFKIQGLKFKSEERNELFDFISIKVRDFNYQDKDCVIVLDEISITSKLCYDNSTGSSIGNVTLPKDINEIATNVLVFILSGFSNDGHK